MKTVGIICEYNPFHNGHQKQLEMIRSQFGEDTVIVCLMSGNYTQNGNPAVFPKLVRAAAAVRCGADLVLELPLTYALASAERFAAGGVSLMEALGVDVLCFGAENADTKAFLSTARVLLSREFDSVLVQKLRTGVSYAAAREQTAEQFGCAALLKDPNNILGVEYCKAILRGDCKISPCAVQRAGSYLAELPDVENPSARSIRMRIQKGEEWLQYVPAQAVPVYRDVVPHFLQCGERAMLARLRCLRERDFERVPYGSEGLWRKLMRACRSEASVENIISAVKSKRYARTRIFRMLQCAYLGITENDMESEPPYFRVLAFREPGRAVIRRAKNENLPVIDSGEQPEDEDYYALECRAADLYALYSAEDAGIRFETEQKSRNFYAEK